jgi:hypothetical protein
MNISPASIVVAITGGILIAGTALQIAASSRQPEKKAAVVFEAPADVAKPSAEPLFPGLPAR